MENAKRWLNTLGPCPELEALKEVPQPAQWHSEGDAYVHTLMVIEEALDRYPNNYNVLLGALCHDFGKALTQKTWPKHYGHANLGIKPTVDFLSRLGMDSQTIENVAYLTKYHMHVHDAFKLKATTLIRMWQDAKCNLILVSNLCRLGICDHYGRGGVDPSEVYENPYHMLACFKIISGYAPETLSTTNLKSIIRDIKELRANVRHLLLAR